MADRDVGRLDEIKQRAAAITPGPWTAGEMPDWEPWQIVAPSKRYRWTDDAEGTQYDVPTKVISCDEAVDADAEFIAHAPDDVAWLLAENERLQAENERLRGGVHGHDVVKLTHVPAGWSDKPDAWWEHVDACDSCWHRYERPGGVSSEVDTK